MSKDKLDIALTDCILILKFNSIIKDRNMLKYFIISICIISLITECKAQNPPCLIEYLGLTYDYTKPANFPYSTPDMPSNVALGYITLDSICMTSTPEKIYAFLKSQTTDIRKLYYDLHDYNTFLYKAFQRNYNPNYLTLPDHLTQIIESYLKNNGKIKFGSVLYKSGIIAQVHVDNSFLIYDTAAAIANNQIVVNCTVVETIKGKIAPSCKLPVNLSKEKANYQNLYWDGTYQPLHPGNCLQFIYCLEWKRGKNAGESFCEKTMVDSLGQPLIKDNVDYIVFLKPMLVCDGSNKYYFSLSPIGYRSEMFTLYPIINGIVIDEGDDFGFGKGLSAPSFKNKLREKINQISNYK